MQQPGRLSILAAWICLSPLTLWAQPHAGVNGPRLRIIGSVQDGGLPHAACECRRCDTARSTPAARRYVASVALILPPHQQLGSTDGATPTERVYVIDATPDIREQLQILADVRHAPGDRTDRQPLDGVLLTHAHIGHYLGLAFFGFEAVHTQGLAVYCSPRMAGFLRDNGPWSQMVRIGNVDLRESPPEKAFMLQPGIRVTPWRVPHREEYSDTVGFLIAGSRQRVLYIPDTEPWARWDRPLLERLDAVAGGVNVLIIDGTFYSADELPGRAVSAIGHPLIVDTMDLLQDRVAAGTLRVLFTHLNHSNPALETDSAARRTIEARGFAIAREGQELPL